MLKICFAVAALCVSVCNAAGSYAEDRALIEDRAFSGDNPVR